MRNKKDNEGKEMEDTDPMGMGEVWQFTMMLCMGLAWLTKGKIFAWGTVVFYLTSILNFRFEHMFQQAAPCLAMIALVYT